MLLWLFRHAQMRVKALEISLYCLMGLVVLKMAHSESAGHLDQVRVVSIASFVFVFS